MMAWISFISSRAPKKHRLGAGCSEEPNPPSLRAPFSRESLGACRGELIMDSLVKGEPVYGACHPCQRHLDTNPVSLDPPLKSADCRSAFRTGLER